MVTCDRDPGLDTLLDLHGQTLFVDEIGHWVKGASKNASWMIKDDRIGHSHRFGGKMNSAFRGISSPGNGDLPVKEDIRYTPRTAYAQPTIPRRCNPTRRRML